MRSEGRPMYFDGCVDLRRELEVRFLHSPDEFPFGGAVDYPKALYDAEEYIKNRVGDSPDVGAAASGEGRAILTKHGWDHTAVVLKRETQLLGGHILDLKGYEVFLLAFATYVHDVGNAWGRDDHESRVAEVVAQIATKVSTTIEIDNPWKKVVTDIASAHGGDIRGSKDTIQALEESVVLNTVSARPQLLAAILRFADEISEDPSRAQRFLQDTGQIPRESIVYHEFSRACEVPHIAGQDLLMRFDLTRRTATTKYGKKGRNGSASEVYLYDEILSRTKKTFLEMMYCMRFTRPIVDLRRVRVTISVAEEDSVRAIVTDYYTLAQTGHPLDRSLISFDSLCLEKPTYPDGKELFQAVKKRSKENAGSARG